VKLTPYWLDTATPSGDYRRNPVPERVDIAIVGAGFTGLWTAIELTDRDRDLDIVVLEAETVGYGASGRNGGFVDPSLTHGLHNGLAHFPDENDELIRLGNETYARIVAFVQDHAIDAHLHSVGTIDVATEPWQARELEEAVEVYERAGESVQLLDADEVRKRLDTPSYHAGHPPPDAGGNVDPGALARGIARVARERGVTLHERSPVTSIDREGQGVVVRTSEGQVRAPHVVLATNAYSHRLLPRTGRWFVPIYDYVLLTEPLSAEQLARIGWEGREGLADSANQFHYYRLTPDDRILWGGYDAVYRFGSPVGPRYDHRRATYDLLARNFRRTFPQLADVRFERWWGGPIATTTRFTVTFGEEMGGRVVWALGYTGLGVGASRFAADVLADKLLDPGSPRLRLRLVTDKPFPFPPEPLRWAGVHLTRRAITRADRRDGRRGPWLATLDRFGIGFDS
jgi:glycine/D-amino acid oxidase-like deaminating enzyme